MVLDETQIALLSEECILVDADDKIVGSASKKECHLMENIKKGMLHRAFSVFLFNNENKLLLQQRSEYKITFPLYWTNTCCSHPLYTAEEMDPKSFAGVKRAAKRKLHHELGICMDDYEMDDLKFQTRILYKAPSDGKWGEHELDYILFLKGDFKLNINSNEVKTVKFVSKEELESFLNNKNELFTPWFKLISDSFLFSWWDQEVSPDERIHNFYEK